MLKRQKIMLALLDCADHSLSHTAFVKLSFLLREETEIGKDSTYYGFVPYRFGPFSFALYRELDALACQSYIEKDEHSIRVHPSMADAVKGKIQELPSGFLAAVRSIVGRYGSKPQKSLLRDVYKRYPWYATKSELTDLVPATVSPRSPAFLAVYTAGYERNSVDGFFDRLLRAGIQHIADVRANPVSRKYGFARSSLSAIAGKLGMGYRHLPQLGIPSAQRASLSGFASYQRLMELYEDEILPRQRAAIAKLAQDVQDEPTVLVCVEHDVRCCHRSRLAEAVARKANLSVKHL